MNSDFAKGLPALKHSNGTKALSGALDCCKDFLNSSPADEYGSAPHPCPLLEVRQASPESIPKCDAEQIAFHLERNFQTDFSKSERIIGGKLLTNGNYFAYTYHIY